MMVTWTSLEATQLVRCDRVLFLILSVEPKGFAETLEMGYREDSVETPRYVHRVTKSQTRLSDEHNRCETLPRGLVAEAPLTQE